MDQADDRRPLARRAIAAVLVAALLPAACGDDDDSADAGSSPAADAVELLGPEDPAQGEPVRIGLVSDGQFAAGDRAYELDIGQAAATYVNEHRGGIGGRPIELVTCVTEADPAKGTDCGNQMVEEEVVAVVVGSSAVTASVWEPLHQAGVPVVFYGASDATVSTDTESTFALSSPLGGLVDLPIATAEAEGEDKVSVVVVDIPAAVALYDSIGPSLFEAQGIDLDVVKVSPGTADMTPQMQQLADGDPGVVHVIGNDVFCIAAFNGLRSVAFDGPVTTIAQCMTDATVEAVPGDFFEGMRMSATAPVGTDDPAVALYHAVVDTYADEEPGSETGGISMFTAVAGMAAALEGISGDITPATVISTIKAMPEMELPGSGGLRFRCNGNAIEFAPAVCTRGTLLTTLDASGAPTTYEVVGDTPIED
jgi:ABC-type branched-subunit amino acid transport system substrate-binding protein